MDEEMVKIIGYHGTCSNFKESIEEYGLDPAKVKYRDDHWLGQGVYFFTDYDQALWWAEDIADKKWNQGSFPIIYQVTIAANESEVLNLDDYRALDNFMTVILGSFKELEKEAKEKIKNGEKPRSPVFKKEDFRAMYFDYYKEQYNISVIIASFEKNSIRYGTIRNSDELMEQKSLLKAFNLGYKEKQVCVSKKECITELIMAYNGEDEVI